VESPGWRDAGERAAVLGLLEWLEGCQQMAAASGNAATAVACAAALGAARAELGSYEAGARSSALAARSVPSGGRDAVRARQLGAAVHALRRERGMSQQSLAAAAGVSRLHIGKIERGQVSPNWRVVVAIAEALEVHIAALAARAAAER
jgi:XRE family transcriptional regulator, regulator of sulfur utilization